MPNSKSEIVHVDPVVAAAIGVFLVPVFVVLLLPATALQAYALMKAWNWFLPELFHFPPISWAAALAVLLVLGASKTARTPPKESAGIATILFVSYFAPLMSLAFCGCLRAALNAGWLTF